MTMTNLTQLAELLNLMATYAPHHCEDRSIAFLGMATFAITPRGRVVKLHIARSLA